jgi:uncharacterized CHY-type Zn-finger protein
MPIAVVCGKCQKSLKVPEKAAGRIVHCPQCGKDLQIPAVESDLPVPRSAWSTKSVQIMTPVPSNSTPVEMPRSAPPKAAAAPPPAPPPLPPPVKAPVPASAVVPKPATAPAMNGPTVVCAQCSAKIKTKPEWAGKKLPCPKCKHIVPVPIKPAPLAEKPPTTVSAPVSAPIPPKADDDGWIDITEPYLGSQPALTPQPSGGAAGDWGQGLLTPLEVPDDMVAEIQKAVTKGERIAWAARADLDIMLHRAKKTRLMGFAMAGVAALILLPLAVALFINAGALVGCVVLVMALGFAGIGAFLIGEPGRTLRNAAKRPCYMMTNRRILIHPGTGVQTTMKTTHRGGQSTISANATFDPNENGLWAFFGLELMAMARADDKAFPGCGDLFFGRNAFDDAVGGSMSALRDVAAVEKKIRETLLNPLIDKLLRGEISLKDQIGINKKPAHSDTTETLPPDGNIKDFAADRDDANIKQFRSAVQRSLTEVDEELREECQAELTNGETLIWIGSKTGKGGGLLSKLVGPKRIEPNYTHYALTNRRVMLFYDAKAGRGPASYYPPNLLEMGLEDEKSKTGSIIFRKVSYRYDAKDSNGKIKKVHEMHYFGILQTPNVVAVARTIYETLVRPVRRN